jgi:SAM-dependent methyltransferase
MREVSFNDCMNVLKHYKIDVSHGSAIDVGGTETVCLKNERGNISVTNNPFLKIRPDIHFLDRGFNIEFFQSKAHETIDFLNFSSIQHLGNSFDLTFCFDTLEHVSNPFLFCDHLIHVTKPGGYVYVSTLFNFVYHPSPEDFFRFTPAGLSRCFTDPVNQFKDQITVIWSGWERDGEGVGALIYKGTDKSFEPHFPVLPPPEFVTIRPRNKFQREVASLCRKIFQ